MSICPIPGFGPNAVLPTRENIAAAKSMLLFPVAAFADAYHYFDAGQQKQAAPDQGNPPKYWCDPNAHRPGRYVFLKRNADGTYATVKLTRDAAKFPIHLNLFSPSALSFLIDERPGMIDVPDLEIRSIPYEEVGRLSFPAFEVEDPIDVPLAWVDGIVAPEWTTSFNKSAILLENGVPQIASIEEANRKWPLSWKPTPVTGPASNNSVGVTDTQFVEVARKLVSSSTARQQALLAINAPGRTDAGKRAELLKL